MKFFDAAALDQIDPNDALAMLAWQVELGADEAILDTPIDRFELPKTVAKPAAPAKDDAPATEVQFADPVSHAKALAKAAGSLDALKSAVAGYEHCELKKGARNLVFADGKPGARIMVIGEAPGRDEDRVGKPFVGPAGQLLDAMFAAIGITRDADETSAALYITSVLPWRPPQNRDPSGDDIEMMMPFLARHIALAKPEIIVVMGNIAAGALLGKQGITRLRGQWTQAQGLPCLPMFHPAYLLRQPLQKRAAWADLQALRAKLDT
ncbi:MAG: uracil-DNA glycosylase family 4 [Sulfitobacter sp.]|jgi:DNA polymerase